MSRHLFDSPLGAQIAPIGVPKNVIGIGAAALAAGIMATGSTINTAISNQQANLSSLTAFNRQKELMDKQQQQSIELHKANLAESYRQDLLHNSPSAQMQRYREAGLNPYLIMQHEGNIGAAASAPASGGSAAPAPSVQQANLQPFQLPEMSGIANMLMASSESKKNDAVALNSTVEFIDKVGHTLGWAQARSLGRELLGVNGIMNSQNERLVESVIRNNELSSERQNIENNISKIYGPQKAANDVALQEQKFNVMAGELGMLASNSKLNDAKIEELASEYVRNLAESFKLKKEGDKYVIEASYYKQLTDLTYNSVQRLSASNKLSGLYVGSPLYKYAGTIGHNKSLVDAASVTDEQISSQLIRAFDKVFGQYFSIVSVNSNSQHNGFNINYNVP